MSLTGENGSPEEGILARIPEPEFLQWTLPVARLIHPEDIFLMNANAIAADMELLTANRPSAPVSGTNTVLGNDLFLEEGVEMECVTINTRTGPVYIGKGARSEEHTSELQSLMRISYTVFCLKQKK